MAAKKGTRSKARRELGEKAGEILAKLDKMLKEGARPPAIEKMMAKELRGYLEVTLGVVAKRCEDEIMGL